MGSGTRKLVFGDLGSKEVPKCTTMYIMMSTSCRNNRISTKYIVCKVKPDHFPVFFKK